jgi:hypothetical protein
MSRNRLDTYRCALHRNAFLLRGFAIVSREQFGPCRTALRMVVAANLVEVAALVGDTARATMLSALTGCGKTLWRGPDEQYRFKPQAYGARKIRRRRSLDSKIAHRSPVPDFFRSLLMGGQLLMATELAYGAMALAMASGSDAQFILYGEAKA